MRGFCARTILGVAEMRDMWQAMPQDQKDAVRQLIAAICAGDRSQFDVASEQLAAAFPRDTRCEIALAAICACDRVTLVCVSKVLEEYKEAAVGK